MFWLFYVILQIFVWNYNVREALVGANPVTQMTASALNDVIWLPLAAALPLYTIFLIRNVCNRLIVREVCLFLFVVTYVVSCVNLDFLFRIQFVFFFVFFLLWGMHIFRSRRVSIQYVFFAVALVGTIAHYNMQLLPRMPKKTPHTLSILSFNFNTKSAYDDERTIQFIRKRIPDIIFLQELTGTETHFILKKLGHLYPYYLSPAPRMGKNDVMILSRKEMIFGDQIPLRMPFGKSFHSVNHAVISVNGQRIHLLNCHFHHAYKEFAAYLFAPDSVNTYKALQRSYARHRDEAKLLANYVQKLDGPTIVAGDFNDTPNSYIYGLYQEELQNAFDAAGWGLGTTFGEWSLQNALPAIFRGLAFDTFRIDHLFFSSEFRIYGAWVDNIAAFDHRPQIVNVALKESD